MKLQYSVIHRDAIHPLVISIARAMKLADRRVQLTKASIESLQPQAKSYLVHDATLRGLCIKVRPTGRKTFMVYRSVEGRPTKVTIGVWPQWNVVAARTKATTLMSDLAQGKHKSRRGVPTLAELVSLYTQHLVASGKRHPGYLEATCRLSWKPLMNRRVDSITSVELTETHNEIAVKRGKCAAARAVKVLRSLFAYAQELDLTDKNPAKRVRVQDSRPREVFLGQAHLPIFWRALATMPEVVQHYFALLLFTGARRSNVAGMAWKDVNLDAALWTIPAEQAKGGRKIHVPLIPEAVTVLRARASDGPWVFPSKKAKCGHLVEPIFWLQELREKTKELGCDVHWTIHDLRRTHASMLTAAGVPLTVVAKALGHANVQTTPIYARVGVETVRDALDSARGLLTAG